MALAAVDKALTKIGRRRATIALSTFRQWFVIGLVNPKFHHDAHLQPMIRLLRINQNQPGALMASVISEHGDTVVELISKGKSCQEVSTWLLANGIKISRQSVHIWYRRRLAKVARLLKMRNAIFESSPVKNEAANVVISQDFISNPRKSLGQIIEKSEMHMRGMSKATPSYFPLPIKSKKSY
jgi:hypothetical protein